MRITGYKLQYGIRELERIHGVLVSQFDDSLYAFDGEEKLSPHGLTEQIRDIEIRIARLQVAQMRYNLANVITVQGEVLTLAEAVKRVGGAGRVEKMWRSAATIKKDRYSCRDETPSRNADTKYAARTVTLPETLQMAQRMGRFASALREAIQDANTKEIEIEDLDPSLLPTE